MKVGDLVKEQRHRIGEPRMRVGLLVERVQHNQGVGCSNKVFSVLWRDGTTTTKVWDWRLEVISAK